jgi:hypothetical protein
MDCLLDALEHAWQVLGLDRAAGGDEVFRDLVLARIIEPVSKLDSLRMLEEAGVAAASYRTVKRRLAAYAKDSWRRQISAACAAHAGLGPASLVLSVVSTLYFETDTGDGFREPGFSKERRLEPQITIGLLTDQAGFPLMIEAFEGNKAETMLPVITAFMAAHQLPPVLTGERASNPVPSTPGATRVRHPAVWGAHACSVERQPRWRSESGGMQRAGDAGRYFTGGQFQGQPVLFRRAEARRRQPACRSLSTRTPRPCFYTYRLSCQHDRRGPSLAAPMFSLPE